MPAANTQPKAIVKKKRISKMKRNEWLWGYLMITPTLIGLIALYIWPSFHTFYLSFTKWQAFGNYEWDGLSNYQKMLKDPELITTLKNTAVFTALSVPISISLAIVIAVLLNQKLKGLTFYRTVYFLPVVTIPAAVAMVWKWLYSDNYGLINYFLSWFGIEGTNWLTNPSTALLSIVGVSIWLHVGYYTIFFLSGLQGIPQSLYESASIDGAGIFRKFFKITLPLLTPTIFFVSVISLIDALQVFDLVFMMIEPTSPVQNQTRTLVVLFFEQAFESNNKGYASAIACFIFVIILTITLVQVKLQKKWVHYE